MTDVGTFSLRPECGTCCHPSNSVETWKALHKLHSYVAIKDAGIPKAGAENFDLLGYKCCYLPSRKFWHDGPCVKVPNHGMIKENERVIRAQNLKKRGDKVNKQRKDKVQQVLSKYLNRSFITAKNSGHKTQHSVNTSQEGWIDLMSADPKIQDAWK